MAAHDRLTHPIPHSLLTMMRISRH